MMEYLYGIDGSTTNCGVSVYKVLKKSYKLIYHTAISPTNLIDTKKLKSKEEKKSAKKENMDYRIECIMKELGNLFKKYPPTIIRMEDTYASKDMYAYKKLSHLQGLVLGYAIINDCNYKFKPPLVWRKEVGIPISIDKKKVQREEAKKLAVDFIKKKYNMTVSDDEAESMCIALSYFEELDK